MKAYIGKSIAKGKVVAPASKSYGHRLLIASYLAGGGTISNLGSSDDIEATKACLAAFSSKEEPLLLPCNESGSTLRFLIPLALLSGKKAHFVGTERLFSRGLGAYERIFLEQGIRYSLGKDGLFLEGRLPPGLYRLDGGVSSQFITGLLFALPLLEGDSVIEIEGRMESAPYVEMTLEVLSRFGIAIEKEGARFLIRGKQEYHPIDTIVEGDESNAAFFSALNALGGEVEILGLNPDTLQGDRVHREFFDSLSKGFSHIDLGNAIDLGPICFGLASLLFGARFTDIRRLRIKESDRVKEMASICREFGATVKEEENEITILPAREEGPMGEIVVPNDHRLVMATSIMLTRRGGTVVGAEAIRKSYPRFFEDLSSLGVEVRLYD